MKIRTKSLIGLSFLVTICLIVFIALNANRFMKSMSQNNSRLYDAYRISELMRSFRNTIAALESKERSYIVTGDAKFREEYRAREIEVKAYLQDMEQYFVDKPEEAMYTELKTFTYKRLMQAKDLSQAMPGIPKIPGSEDMQERGAESLVQINHLLGRIDESLAKTTKALIDNSISYVRSSKSWGLMEVGVGLLATLIAVIILFRDVDVRNRLEAELRVAKKQADDNARMKEQFMANMSHEIRTPMNAILGFANLLHKTELDASQAEYLSAIRDSSANLLNIINDILDFSKIEAGMLRLEKIPFSPVELIKPLRVVFEEKSREKELAFLVRIDERVPAMIYGDPTRLTQILVNLLNNAIKFTARGSVSLLVEVEALHEDTVGLLFRIKDTGIGIPEDKHKDVFERFNQGNAETTRKYGGTGLGLSIVRSLVEMQEGQIRFSSTEGKGTEFLVSISYPVSREQEAEADQELQPTDELPQKKAWKVLLAEDNLLNQKLTTILLSGFGLDTEVAEDGEAVLQKLKIGAYDLILMDIQMPVLDGYQTTLRIRKELGLQLPIIAMTAHSMESELQKCLSYGMNDYISKPFREDELRSIVFRYLEGQPVQPEESAAVSMGEPDFSALYNMTGSNREFLRDLIEIFVSQNPLDTAELTRAAEAGDFETISLVAHRMKTSVGFIGLVSLLQPLSEMEQLGKQLKGLEQIRSLSATVTALCAKAVEQLRAKLEAGIS